MNNDEPQNIFDPEPEHPPGTLLPVLGDDGVIYLYPDGKRPEVSPEQAELLRRHAEKWQRRQARLQGREPTRPKVWTVDSMLRHARGIDAIEPTDVDALIDSAFTPPTEI